MSLVCIITQRIIERIAEASKGGDTLYASIDARNLAVLLAAIIGLNPKEIDNIVLPNSVNVIVEGPEDLSKAAADNIAYAIKVLVAANKVGSLMNCGSES